MDVRVYYTFELLRIANSPGASEELRQALHAELVLREHDPTRNPNYGQEAPRSPTRKRRSTLNAD